MLPNRTITMHSKQIVYENVFAMADKLATYLGLSTPYWRLPS